MTIVAKTIETTGMIDSGRRLLLDEFIPIKDQVRVRVMIMLSEESEINEDEWLQAGASNPAFDFLKDQEEDIYTINDGRPFYDQG